MTLHAHAHDSAAKHVSGQAHYIDDLVEPVGTCLLYTSDAADE